MVEDESSLQRRINFSASSLIILLLIIAFTAIAGAFGIFILASTPMKNYLPGYLKDSERTATEEQHLRLDSLIKVYEVNEAYVSGILNALNPTADSLPSSMSRKPNPLTPNALKSASPEEKEFMEQIRERDKYNIGDKLNVVPAGMIFGNVNKNSVITEDSKNQYQADIVVPEGSSISAIAEGKVISIASSPKSSGGYDIIIQHPNGFLSKYGRLSGVMVRQGEKVAGGQIIASSVSKQGMKPNHVSLELWHDGDPLIPAEYLNGGNQSRLN